MLCLAPLAHPSSQLPFELQHQHNFTITTRLFKVPPPLELQRSTTLHFHQQVVYLDTKNNRVTNKQLRFMSIENLKSFGMNKPTPPSTSRLSPLDHPSRCRVVHTCLVRVCMRDEDELIPLSSLTTRLSRHRQTECA